MNNKKTVNSKRKTKGEKRRERKQKNMELILLRQNSLPSTGELRIMNFLEANGIEYIREYTERDLKSAFGFHLFFDFYLPDYDVAIEFDGIYHYKPVEGQLKLFYQQKRDWAKNHYCKKNGIKLLRIPYWRIDDTEYLICAFFENISKN